MTMGHSVPKLLKIIINTSFFCDKKHPTWRKMVFMVQLVDSRWNQVYANLMIMYEKLGRFGFTYRDGKVLVIQSYVSSKSLSITSSESSKL
jgi:hypothetical protein